MKKIIVSVIVIVLVLAMTLCLFACGEDKSNSNSGNNTNTNANANQGGTNANQGGTDTNQGGTNQGTTPSGDNGGSQSGNNSGNQGSQGGDQAVQTVTLATRASILSAIGDTYKVVAAGLYDGYPTTVASDGIYFYTTAPSEVFYKKIAYKGNDTFLYSYSYKRSDKYHRIGNPVYTQDGSAPTMLGRGAVGDMLQFAGETLSYNTVEATTFLNRAAKKYTFDGTNAYGYDSFHEEVIIDDLTGACLRYDNQGRAGAGFTGGTRNKAAFEVTEFSYGAGNTAARTLLDAQIAKIDVYAWENAFLTSIGLSDTSAPQGELWYSNWENDGRKSRDSETPDWQAEYRVYCTDSTDKVEVGAAFMRAIYDAGAKYDYNGTLASYDDLAWDDGDGSMGLTAYVGDYVIEIYVDYIGGDNSIVIIREPYWRIITNVRLADE